MAHATGVRQRGIVLVIKDYINKTLTKKATISDSLLSKLLTPLG